MPAAGQVNVLTYQYDLSRDGLNSHEVTLTKANVNATQFGKLFSYPVDGLVYAQPLYVGNVNIPGKGAHNVVYVATEHDSVYAFDADSNAGSNSAALWSVSFINPGAGVTTFPAADTGGCGQIFPEIGITGTPVIDPGSGTIYLVAMTKETSGASVSYVARLHALDITTGAERTGSPVVIQASFPGTAGGTVTFQTKNYKQRPGLLLLNGVVYTAWSSHCDEGLYYGWLIGYDAQSLQQVVVYNNTPAGGGASFWAGGAAPAADSAGNIYLVGGNGTLDVPSGGRDLGESYIKLSTTNGVTVSDYFTPFNYSELNARDADVGSAGVVLLPDDVGSTAHPHLMTGAGKEGRIYLLDRDAMGGWRSGSDSQIVQSIPGAIDSLFGNPAYFNHTVYLCSATDFLKAFPINNAQMATTASSQSPESFDFPGCVPSISANGTANGIVWALEASKTLHAYDASNVANELYNSNQNAARDALDSYVKFTAPTIANGKVYVGTDTTLTVFGLLSPPSAIRISNTASGDATAIAPGTLFSIYGAGLTSSGSLAGTFPLGTQLAGSSVTVDGVRAPLLYASPLQINAQAPFETPPGNATVMVSSNGSTVATGQVNVQPAVPGIFLLTGGHAAVLNQDFSVNASTNPAAAGSYISVYVTGLGAVNPAVQTGAAASSTTVSQTTATVGATIGGVTAKVPFAGLAPGFVGLYQVNVIVPQMAAGDYPLVISAAGAGSNSATVSVK